ncbi:SDR family oxidoreductase [Tuwongella immobilis]|uniref:Ketoreductase domain-containing protein n=1 Tax=Tuwongella immobilis TaxID=692036 RepID=A0A6C2YVE7_9BACT|nr:SDR family oxidoreductase [Tuwongella immobilis]VIP04842.1 short-chain dehydrogenase reductase sdr : Oxidoreductase, short-chain dehydrogenase/reductase family protein OS=uncultured planctomycete GN=HGMM_F13D05C11 PE=3 SV=1: adh_short [Tuwongella immobilis]VTS07044.1 short-chain dehydrogenase reductase sdr : Oxidoreductase, short-chain dehydrogenase/reductase family protein OS=uncultured planctomycete GN=HGMM_F13D05C11 PE=3 SV=1: adh_short [Tuwongella immobilis]
MGRRRELNGLRVLITGASQGIGRALAIAAWQRGMRVMAAARSQQLLDELQAEVMAKSSHTDAVLEIVVADVSTAEGRQRMVDAAQQKFGGLDVLVNNAGIGATGHFVDTDPQVLRQIMETNFFGTTETTRLFLPMLRAGNSPAIVMISSVAGRQAVPARSLYSASKYAVQGFSEALRAELDKDGIDVVIVNPGLTQTNFSKNMLEQKARMKVDHMRGMTSEEVALRTLDALAKGKHEITLTGQAKLMIAIGKFLPGLFHKLAKKKVRELFAEEIADREKRLAAERANASRTS